jgi:hypothetical protein
MRDMVGNFYVWYKVMANRIWHECIFIGRKSRKILQEIILGEKIQADVFVRQLDFLEFISEEDYKEIIDAIYHLAEHSSSIDFPSFPTYDNLVKDILTSYTSEITNENALIIDGEDIVLLKI